MCTYLNKCVGMREREMEKERWRAVLREKRARVMVCVLWRDRERV